MNRPHLLKAIASWIAVSQPGHPTRVAIDGVDGVGKTTLADELAASLREVGRRVIRASVDGFHNPRSVRYRRGKDSPEGYFFDSFDYGSLRSELLHPLGPGGSRQYRPAVFNYKTDSELVLPYQHAEEQDVLLFDGVFLQCRQLDGCWDRIIWLEASFEVTVPRAARRDAASLTDTDAVLSRYHQKYVPGQTMYLELCRPKEKAELVIRNEDYSNPEVERAPAGWLGH